MRAWPAGADAGDGCGDGGEVLASVSIDVDLLVGGEAIALGDVAGAGILALGVLGARDA